MRLVLDAGALIAVERSDRDTIALLKHELSCGRVPLTHGGVIGQVWRGGAGHQANLARLLPALEIASLDGPLGRRAWVLLGKAKEDDVIDAALVPLSADGDWLITSDSHDIAPLAVVSGLHLDIVPV